MIKLSTVSMCYPGGVTALHETTIDFKKGQFTVLIGSSGAGKSTLLRCINMLNSPTTGSVEIEGLGKLNDKHLILQKHRQNTAMVFQQHQLIGRHTALQNVLVGRIGKFSSLRSLFPFPEQDKMIALECLKRVELLYKANERVDRLSGGQQQRVGIARGLAQQPHIMLADEPVASLDPATSHKVLSLLYNICREDNLTAIVSLHQVELAKEFGDRVIGLAGGRVVFDGHPEELSDDILGVIYHKTYIHESVFKQRDGKADGSERTYEVAASSI